MESEDYKDEGVRWVKVEGCEYRLDKEQILEWLSYFGEVRSDLTEDTHEESDDSADDLPIGNGIYLVKMKLSKDMPQFMPMYGKRVRIYYRGITKRCTNCFQPHQRKHCKNEKVTWFEYVKGFADILPDIPNSMYGRWGSMIGKTASTVCPNKETNVNQEERKENTESEDQSLEVLTRQIETKMTRENERKDSKKQGEVEEDEEDESEERNMDEEELAQLVKKMLASGISAKSLKKTMEKETKETKAKMKSLTLAKGRGRGAGRGGKAK